MMVVCYRCLRGREACAYCHDTDERDWEAMCDCGLHDFGAHLLPCEDYAEKRWIIPADYAAAEEPRS